jgi:hypothetical protein
MHTGENQGHSGASDKITTTVGQSIPLTREEALQAQPNSRVFRFEANARRAYPVHYFCDNTEGVRNHNAYTVCTYHGVWYQVKPDQVTGKPVLAEAVLEIHAYDIKDQDGQSEPDSNNKQQMDPTDNAIWRSPINISPVQAAAPVMSATRMQPAITVQVGGGNAPPSRPGTPPAMTTLASLQMRLNAALQ